MVGIGYPQVRPAIVSRALLSKSCEVKDLCIGGEPAGKVVGISGDLVFLLTGVDLVLDGDSESRLLQQEIDSPDIGTGNFLSDFPRRFGPSDFNGDLLRLHGFRLAVS